MSREDYQRDLLRYCDLLQTSEAILLELARDAARSGFDVSSYFQRLIELDRFQRRDDWREILADECRRRH